MRSLFLASLFAVILLSSFHKKEINRVHLPKEFVLIPAGELSVGYSPVKKISVPGFYISKYEVSNEQYRDFLTEVSSSLSVNEKEKIGSDSTGWNQVLGNNTSMKNYFQLQAYNDYPVVNISHDGAASYSQWLQKKLRDANPGLDIEVRLPSKEEWIWAATGGRSQAMFPWSNYYLRNNKGAPMCNFKTVKDGFIHRNRQTGRPEIAVPPPAGSPDAVFTTDVKSFYKNDYGLYNMCGNAAEMVQQPGIAMGGSWNDYGGDVHIRAESAFAGSAPTIGFRPVVIVREKK